MIRTIGQYKNFWKALAQAEGIEFVYGGIDRVLNRQQADMVYPCLWVGVPEIKRVYDGSLRKGFEGWFIVLRDAEGDDLDAQDSALDEMEALTERIIARMCDAVLTRQFDFNPEETVSYPKFKQTGDDTYGWFTEFRVLIPSLNTLNCDE